MMDVRENYDGDNIYYNVVVRNTTQSPVRATFTETRTVDLLSNPSKYYLSIIRFYVPGTMIPIFDFPDPTSVLPDAVKFYVTIQRNDGANIRTEQVLYTASDTTNTFGGVERPVTTFQQFLDAINTALLAAATFLGIAADTPYVFYDATTQLFSLRAKTTVFYPGNVNPATGFKIWFNTSLRNYFESMQGLNQGYARPDFLDFNVYVKNNGNNFDTITNQATMTTEVNTQYLWPDLVRILFLTSKIPVATEYIHNFEGKNVWTKILTDFEPLLTGDFRFNDVFQYYPQGPYRLLDMNQSVPLREMDCAIFWQSRNGNLYPLMIPPHRDFSIKFLFQRKKDCC